MKVKFTLKHMTQRLWLLSDHLHRFSVAEEEGGGYSLLFCSVRRDKNGLGASA